MVTGVVIPGLLWKKWNRQWMTLDEGGAALRWYRDEARAGNDGTLYMKYVCELHVLAVPVSVHNTALPPPVPPSPPSPVSAQTFVIPRKV